MFATMLGALPTPPVPDDASRSASEAADAAVAMVIRAQEDAGLEPITDGRLGGGAFDRLGRVLERGSAVDPAVDVWRHTAAMTDRAVKQALPGPYSLGRRRASADEDGLAGVPGAAKERQLRTLAFAKALRAEIDALVRAGCPLVEIEETEAHRIGTDDAERELFRGAHHLLVDGMTGAHLSLSIVGGAAHEAGLETVLDAPYASLAVDLIAGPDNWHLVTPLAGDRGVIVGTESARAVDEPKEVLLWAAHYAASTQARGPARVGIGSAGSYANLTWAAAVRKMQLLGEAARLAAMPAGPKLARALDPRALDARRAALGHDAPASRPRRQGEE